MIFVEDMSAEEFRQWWGEANLPPDLQIVTYHGEGVGFDATFGDVLWFWNPGATTSMDYLDGVDFEGQTQARSYAYDPELKEFLGNSSGESQVGIKGAVAAGQGGEVGSPGWVGSVPPTILHIVEDGRGVRVRWRGRQGQKYRLESTFDLQTPSWRVVTVVSAWQGDTVDYTVSAVGRPKAFFRVAVVP